MSDSSIENQTANQDGNPLFSNSAEPEPEPSFGWTSYAEIINGRFAMIGFIALLVLELVTGLDFFTWVGLR